MCAAGLDENCSICFAKRGHKRKNILLKQRLPSGDLDKRALESHHLAKHLIKRFLSAFEKGILCIAVTTS